MVVTHVDLGQHRDVGPSFDSYTDIVRPSSKYAKHRLFQRYNFDITDLKAADASDDQDYQLVIGGEDQEMREQQRVSTFEPFGGQPVNQLDL